MPETLVIDGYEIRWTCYISQQCSSIENKNDIKSSYNIYLLEPFIGCAEGTFGMFLKENRAVRIPHYRRAAEISVPRYMETALYENRVLRVLFIGGLWQFLSLRVIS